MAVEHWFGTVSISNNTDVVTITGGDTAQDMNAGMILQVGTQPIVVVSEIINATQVRLVRNWTYGNVSNATTLGVDSAGDLIPVIEQARILGENVQQLLDSAGAQLSALGNASERTVVTNDEDTTIDRLLTTRTYGLGYPIDATVNNALNGNYYVSGSSTMGSNALIYAVRRGNIVLQLSSETGNFNELSFRKRNSSGTWGARRQIRHEGNTTVDGNGFIKAASPIIKLYSNRIEANDQVNDLAFLKINGVGDYTIKDTKGFAKDGWYIEVPKDRHGFPKVLVDYSEDENGYIHVKTYKFNMGLEFEQPIDIPEGRYITIRLQE